MRLALGEYIEFIDQDDYFHPEAIAKVYKALSETALDVLVGDAVWVIGDRISDHLQHNYKHQHVMTGDEMIALNGMPYSPWKFISRRRFIVENDLFFEENQRIEDIDWSFRLIHAAQKVRCLPIHLIYYIKNDVSTTMTAYKSPETTFSAIQMGKRLYELYETIFASSQPATRQNVMATCMITLHGGIRNYFFCRASLDKKTQRLKDALSDYRGKQTWLISIAKSSPRLFAWASNACSPVGLILINLYRYLKYHLHLIR